MLSNLMFIALVFSIDLNIYKSDPIVFKDCGNDVDGIVKSVDISNCSQIPCLLRRGTNVTMKMTFTTNVATKSAFNYMYGIISGVPVPYALPQPDGCKLGLQCPLQAGLTYTENAVFSVLNEYPTIPLFVKLELHDDNQKILACFLVPCKIVN